MDFHYESKDENKPRSFDFSIKGGNTITLSELTQALGILSDTNYGDIDSFLSGVKDVSFSDENLLKVVRMEEGMSLDSVLEDAFDISEAVEVEKINKAGALSAKTGDWLLISRAPFRTEETLTILMNDGETIIINVTDDQSLNLADFITDAVLEIEGRTYGADETWKVREGVDYALKLTFKEEGSRQFPKGGEEMVMNPAAMGGRLLYPDRAENLTFLWVYMAL